MWISIIVTGSFLILGGILQIATGFLGGTTPAEINTVFFGAFIIAAVWNGINCRALDGKMPPFFKGNPTFFIVMSGSGNRPDTDYPVWRSSLWDSSFVPGTVG